MARGSRISTGKVRKKRTGRLAKRGAERVEQKERGGIYRVIYSAIYDAPKEKTGGIGIYIWTYTTKDELDDTRRKLRRKISEPAARIEKEYSLGGGPGGWDYSAYSTQKMSIEESDKLDLGIQLFAFSWRNTKSGTEVETIERKIHSQENFQPSPKGLIGG